MIRLYSEADALNFPVKEFIQEKLSLLLQLYETDTLKQHGEIIIAENEADATFFEGLYAEFTEKIICEKSIIWHATLPTSNSSCKEVYVDERYMSKSLKQEWEDNLIRTVYEDEFQ